MAEGRTTETMARSPSGGATAMLSAVPSSASATRLETPPAPKVEEKVEPKVHLKSLADIANMAGESRDMKLKAQVRQFVRPVRMEPGKLEIALSPDAPKSIANDLFVKLKEWTGIHWIISLSKEQGEPTLVEAEGNARDARLVDARQDPDVAAILAELDFLVVPSISDATTRVILEAFSAGVPVIAARVGGIPEVVRRPETGFLYEGSAPEAIAATIRTALNLKPETLARMRVQAREHWARNFTLDRYRKEMVALLEQAAAQKPRD